MAYNSTNPVFQPKFWNTIQGYDRMSYEGTIQKTGILFGLLTLSSLASIVVGFAYPTILSPLISIGGVCGFCLYLYLLFTRPENPQTLIMIYALFQGMVIGPLTLIFEEQYPGIALNAGFATLGVIGSMLTIYSLRIIRPTPTFNKIFISLTLSIMLVYIIDWLFLLLTPYDVPFLHSTDAGPIGILVSLFIIFVASMMMISNFGMIESGVRMGAPKKQEWWGAFGILITVIWLYVEMLRLLAKLRNSR